MSARSAVSVSRSTTASSGRPRPVYEAERRPVAEHNAARSADPDGSVRGVADELRADLGGRIAHAWLPGETGRASTLDLLGEGLTLFTGPGEGSWAARRRSRSAGSTP